MAVVCILVKYVKLRSGAFCFFADFMGCHHLYHVGLAVTQRYFVAHDAVFYGVVQGGVEQHLNFFTLYEPHLYYPLAKAAVPQYLDYYAFLSCIQF